MSWSVTLFRVRGIPIKIHATFGLILVWAAFTWGGNQGGTGGALFGVVATLLLFACVTLHELGHAVQAMAYGIAVRQITLYPIGGIAQAEEIPEDPKKEFRIAIAGPLVNVALAGALAVVGAIVRVVWGFSASAAVDALRDARWSGLLAYLLSANVILAVFNLLPAFPMDGGRVLRALLAMRLDYARATAIAAAAGQAMALLFGIAGLFTGDIFLLLVAVFVWMGAGQESGMVALRQMLRGATVGQAMTDNPQTLGAEDRLRRAVELTLSTFQSDFPVVTGDDGRVIGLLTADDLLKGLHAHPQPERVDQVMRRAFPTATPDSPLFEAQQRLAADRLPAMPVVANGRLVGLLTALDVAEAYRLLAIDPTLVKRRTAAGSPVAGARSV